MTLDRVAWMVRTCGQIALKELVSQHYSHIQSVLKFITGTSFFLSFFPSFLLSFFPAAGFVLISDAISPTGCESEEMFRNAFAMIGFFRIQPSSFFFWVAVRLRFQSVTSWPNLAESGRRVGRVHVRKDLKEPLLSMLVILQLSIHAPSYKNM